jgi:hypothetical protein
MFEGHTQGSLLNFLGIPSLVVLALGDQMAQIWDSDTRESNGLSIHDDSVRAAAMSRRWLIQDRRRNWHPGRPAPTVRQPHGFLSHFNACCRRLSVRLARRDIGIQHWELGQ